MTTDPAFNALYDAQAALTDARVRLAERRAAYESRQRRRQIERDALRNFPGLVLGIALFAAVVYWVMR